MFAVCVVNTVHVSMLKKNLENIGHIKCFYCSNCIILIKIIFFLLVFIWKTKKHTNKRLRKVFKNKTLLYKSLLRAIDLQPIYPMSNCELKLQDTSEKLNTCISWRVKADK